MPSVPGRSFLIVMAMLVFLSAGLALLGGCAPKRIMRQPEAAGPAARPDAQAGARETSPRGGAVVDMALSQIGRPYRLGGDRPARGFDCSGLVQWSYRNVGVDLPRVVSAQRHKGCSIDAGSLLPGDLVFFRTRGDRISHVGIYVGDGRFVHAPSSGQAVRTDSLSDPYWRGRWADSRRVPIP